MQELARLEEEGIPIQDAGVRLTGDYPLRRSVVRPEGRTADHGSVAQLQVRVCRSRARPGRAVDEALNKEEAGHLLLVYAAIHERVVPAFFFFKQKTAYEMEL